MKTCVDQVIHSAIRNETDNINVLYFGYDGWFESIFDGLDISCYINEDSLLYDWKGNLPGNFTVLPKGMGYIPNRIDIDAIICNSRKGQVYKAAEMADFYHIPLIMIEHEIPNDVSKPKLRQYVNSRLPNRCTYVLPSQLIKDEWYFTDDFDFNIIPYGFKDMPINIRNNDILVVGDYNPQDYGLLNTMMNCHTDVVGIGHNNNITQPYNSVNDIYNAMSQSRICIMANTPSKPPILAMMAMNTECCVITNRTKWTESIIKHEKNGFLFDSAADIKKIARKLMSDDALVSDIAINAKIHIGSNFGYDKFKDSWYNLIHKLITRTYKR